MNIKDFCIKCKHKKTKANQHPCNECMETGINKSANAPLGFVEAQQITIEEAMKIIDSKILKTTDALRNIRDRRIKSFLTRDVEAFDVAIQAMEKQVAKKAKKIKVDCGAGIKHTRYICPSCESSLTETMSEWVITGAGFCDECGQKIRGSEE